MGTIKKLILGLMILVGSITFTMIANSTEVISKKPAIVMITDFSTYDLANFIKATCHLKDKDALKIITIGPGGDALICMSMINHIETLQKRGVTVTTEAQAMVCSANALIWLAGDVRIIHRHDLAMFHLARMMDSMGNKVEMSALSPLNQMILKNINDWVHFKLTRVLRNTEIVNDMLDDPDNWYKGIDLFRLGVATKLIEN